MTDTKNVSKKRNWVLVLVSSILLLAGCALLLLSVLYVSRFGVWSLVIGLSGLTTIGAATMSIIKNDPSWILLDLLLPG